MKTITRITRRRMIWTAGLGALGLGGAFAFGPGAPARAETPLDALIARTHVHGLAADRQDPNRLLIATHHGLHALRIESGLTEQVSDHRDDLMGFVAHPIEPGVLLASS
jgi:hypothetical protein